MATFFRKKFQCAAEKPIRIGPNIVKKWKENPARAA